MDQRTDASHLSATAEDRAIPPIKLAHIVLRTSRYEEMKAWYKDIFGATASFENHELAFLTYDDEHHRIALVNIPGLAAQSGGQVGVHHIAFTYASMADLLATYERLKRKGITPALPINHGPTTSMYYRDPDGNQLEFQIENFDTLEESTAFFFSPEYEINPVGVDFDPEDLLARFRAGVPEAELKKRPNVGPRGMDTIPLD